MAISTNGTIIARLAGGLYNQTLSNATYNEVVASVKSAADINALANSLVATDFAGKTDAQIATVLLTNLGLTSVAGLNNWVAAQITAAGAAGKGAKIVSLLNDFSNLTSDPTYGASASSFNGKVDSALALSQTAGFKGGDINAAATIAAAAKAAADAAAAKVAAEKAAAEAAAAKAAADKAAADKAAADKAAADAAAAKAAADKAAADKAAADKAAADKIAADKAAAEKILTDAADAAAAAASTAIDAATVADAAVTAAQAALAAATTKAALTDATALTAATKTAADASTAAAAAKTAADATLVTANTALSTLLATANPAAADVVTANANVIIAGAKVTAAATAATTAATAAATAKTASDAATADDAAVVTAQTALNTAVTAATTAAAAAVTAVATSKTAAAATAVTTDDAVATAAATVAAAKGAGAAKVTADAAAAAAAAAKATADAAAAKAAADAAAVKATADAAAAKVISDAAAAAAAKATADAAAAKVIADAAAAKVIADALAVEMLPKSFTLTTGADIYVGGKGTNTVTSVIGTDGLASNGTSLNAGDNIAGGISTDTLNVNITGNNTGLVTTAAVTLSSVENITVTNYETTANNNSINLSLAPGVAKISVLGSSDTGDTLFTGARGLVTAEMGNGNGDLSITYVDTVLAATTDVQTLNLTGQTGGTFSALPTSSGAVETVTITSGTSANTVGVTVPGATTINVSGDQNLTLTEGMTNTLTSVNATGFTGRLNFTTDDVTAINVVGGSGADTITLGASFGTTDTINGGGGDDTLSIATAVASATALAGVTNVEALTISSGDLVNLAANVSPTTFNLAQSTAVANTLTLNTGYTNATTVNLGAGDTVTNTANAVLTLNATDAGMIGSVITGGTAADTLNLTASAATTVVTLNTQAIRVDTITIVDGGDTVATAGRDISITAGAAATSVTVNASALDAGVTGATDATGENLTYVGGGVTTATVVQNVTGGGGNDTISGGAGNDIISGGAGNDSLSGGTGNDSINAGTGDDTINMAATLTSADSIDGGEGADKLILSGSSPLPALALTNVSNVETLVLGGGTATVSLAANVSFTTIDMDDGATDTTAQNLTLATGYTNATTVLVDAGDSVTNTANAALTVTSTDAKMAGTTITGGTGSDTVSITATAEGGVALTLASLITNVETINLLDGGDVQANTLGNTVTAGHDVTLTVGNYASAATVATTLTIDASTLDAGTVTTSPTMDANYENATIDGSAVANVLVKLVLTGGGGADSLTGGDGNDVIVGGAGNDRITTGQGNDNLSGGDDIDTFVLAGNLTFQDTISGGGGVDVMTTTGVITDDMFTNVTLVETLTVTGATTLGAAATAAGVVTVNTPTTAAAVNAATTTTGITFNALIAGGAAQAQTLTGGTGADTFNFGSGTTTQDSLSTAETVNGGAGNDTIFISNSVAGVTAELNLNTGKVTNVENVTLGTASGLASTTAETFALTITDVTLTTVQTVSISGAAITDTNDTITITNNATTATGGTSFNITGGAGADTLTGGVNNDTINGGGGADSITGGAGADSLTGAAGADRFVYAATSATNASTTIAKDTISDFTTGTDVLEVNLVATGSVGTFVGSAASLAEGMTLLSGRKGEFFYDTTTKQVHMDTDGNGLIQSTDLTINMGSLAAIAGTDVALSIDSASTTATTGGAGADVFIVSTAANQQYDGGLGNDTFNATQAQLTADDVLVGGGGTDTLNISGAGTSTLTTDANLATIENINLTGTSAQSLNLTGQTEAFKVQMNAAGGTVTVNATVADTLNGGAGADNFTINTVNGHAFLPQATIAGAGGADIITLGLATTTLVDADFANVTLVETLALTGISTIVLGPVATAAGIANVTVGNGATSITSTQTALAVNGAAYTGAGAITLAGSANYTVTNTGQANPANITAGTVTGTLNLSFDDDTTDSAIAVGVANTNVTITGGAVGDVITVTGATAAASFNGSGAKFAYTGGAGVQTITTGALADTVTGAAGADVIDTGAGDDQLIYLATADLFTAGALVDSITGGAGTADQLLVGTTGTAFAIASTDVWTRSSGLEVITAVANDTAVTIALGVSAETAGINAVDISAVTTVATHLINASAYVTAGLTLTGSTLKLTSITGGGGADTILGGAEADVIIGGGGADSITGGGGIDALTGGAGADRFNLSAIVATANRDTIGDFTAGAGGDIVQLGAYTGFVAGTLVTSQTVAGKSDLANRIIIDTIANLGAAGVTIGNISAYTNDVKYAYASDTGALFYDADGDWSAGSFLIATLTVTGTVTAGDNFAIITATAT